MLKELKNYQTYIFTGHFGSGKTETAVNFALELKNYSQKINIVDMDIVNPFFRTADYKIYLDAVGINVIASEYANSNLDIPAIPQNISLILSNYDNRTVLDVGGDDIGAKILSTYREYIQIRKCRTYCVVNIRRPETDSPERIESMIQKIEKASNIKIDALINNTNLANETSVEDIIEGQEILQCVSRQMEVPIAFVCANEHMAKRLPEYMVDNVLVHKIRITLPWE